MIHHGTDSVQDHLTSTVHCCSFSCVCMWIDEAGMNIDTKAHALRLMADYCVISKDRLFSFCLFKFQVTQT